MVTLYFVEAVGLDLIKVGYTTGLVNKRIHTLATGCPVPLKLRLALPVAGRGVEKRVHSLLRGAGLHARGEWFRYADSAKRLVETLTQWRRFRVKNQRPPVTSAEVRQLWRRLTLSA